MSPPAHVDRRRLPIAVAVVSIALVIAGCGSSGKPSSTASKGPSKASPSSFAEGTLKWAACMRSHGVPNLPDPTFGAGGAQANLSTPPGMLTSPAFFSAQKTCAKLGLYGPGDAAAEPATAAQVAQGLAMSRCMRAHRVSNWPDPTTHVPINVNAEHLGVMGAVPNSDLVWLVPESINLNSPAVRKAAAFCGLGLQ
jgi:hypothetical protein